GRRRPGPRRGARPLGGDVAAAVGGLVEEFDVAVGAVHADALTVPEQLGGPVDAHDGGQAVLAGDHRAVRHDAAHLRHQPGGGDEQRGPAGVGVGGDQDVARFEAGPGQVGDDAGAALDRPGRDREPGQRPGRDAAVREAAVERLAVGGEDAGRGERLVGAERLAPLPDEAGVRVTGTDDFSQLGAPEVEDVLSLAQRAGPYEAIGLPQECLLVDEVAADHAVLGVLAVTGEGAYAVDHPLGLLGLTPVREGAQACQHLLLLAPRVLEALFEAALAGARLEVPDVAEQGGQEHDGVLAPARPGDVDLPRA